MKRTLMGLVATLALAVPMLANAVPTSWIVTLEDTNENTYVGNLSIDSSFLTPNSYVASTNWLSFTITVAGTLFQLPTLFPSDGVLIGAAGTPTRFEDPSGNLVQFSNGRTLNFVDGSNNWNLDFGTRVSGTYTITGAVTAVPEPATLGLLGLALAGVGLARRRRST